MEHWLLYSHYTVRGKKIYEEFSIYVNANLKAPHGNSVSRVWASNSTHVPMKLHFPLLPQQAVIRLPIFPQTEAMLTVP